MSKRKKEFELVSSNEIKVVGLASIIGQNPDYPPYLSISTVEKPAFVQDEDLERFAVNILKALKSKKLK